MCLTAERDGDIAKVVIEGSGMERQAGIAAGVFGALDAANIYPALISTSETKIGLIVRADEADRAAEAIRAKYAL
ncbi:MAG: ACT domain-containing protein [Candidatus Spyradocola sp.]